MKVSLWFIKDWLNLAQGNFCFHTRILHPYIFNKITNIIWLQNITILPVDSNNLNLLKSKLFSDLWYNQFMHSHAPQNYDCPFCILSEGNETEYNSQNDIVYQDKNTIAFVSPKWWLNNPGNVLVITKEHYENIYDIPEDILVDVYKTAKKIAIAIRESYPSDGTSIRQHNEPDGGQDVWHFHAHVFPRYKNDNLYQNHDNKRFVEKVEKQQYVKKLKEFLSRN